jgi:deazaflavin-dependent oxidoreductase (nitroreductase family)
MANPFAMSRTFHRIGHVTNTAAWRLAPTPIGLGVLTTTGRKSGKQRHRAIRAMRSGDRVYVVAMFGERCDWVHNIRAHPDVRIKLGNRTYEATARELTDSDERQRAADAYLQHAGWFDHADYANLNWSLPTKEKVARSHAEWFERGTPVVLALNGPSG